jgi:hypothetical protein
MSSLPKGESMGTKLAELFANMVVERRNLIMTIYGGVRALRVLGELIQGEFLSFVSFLCFLSFSWLFFTILTWFDAFRTLCWSYGFSFF